MKHIKNLLLLILFLANTLLVTSSIVFASFFKSRDNSNIFEKISNFWYKLIVFPLNIKIHGINNIDLKKTYVIMANHQSLLDIPLIYKSIPLRFCWVAKEEVKKLPIFGKALEKLKCIYVRRTKNTFTDRMYYVEQMKKRFSEGYSIMIFPEGTRSIDGKVLPFKKSGFITAFESQAEILPITIKGSRNVVPKRAFSFLYVDTSAKIDIYIHPPIDTKNYSEGKELIEDVKDIIEKFI